MTKNLVILLIELYRVMLSPFKVPCCRFIPTCSEYAILAVKRYGVIKGLWLAAKRVSRCHPFHPGGYDPI